MKMAHLITQALKGRWHGSYGMCCCPVHADATPSMKVTVDVDGKPIVHCFAGCDWRHIKDELRRRGILNDRETEPMSAHLRVDFERRAKAGAELSAKNQQRKIAIAKGIWAESQSACETLVPAYLRSRGFNLPVPPSIRGLSSLHHYPTGQNYPVMVAAVCRWPGRDVIGIHRTFLASDGRSKADTTPNKMMLGRCDGGAVRLAPAGERLAITEGIETGLSVMQAMGIPTWAALSASGIKGLQLPPSEQTKRIVICADNDPTGIAAANDTAEAWRTDGYMVSVATPPTPGTDFNDLIIGDSK